jgi:DNA-binding SARP family transcriptional activator
VETAAALFIAEPGHQGVPFERLEAWMRSLGAVAPARPWLLYYQAWVAAALRQQRLAELTLERAWKAFSAEPAGPERERALRMVRLALAVVLERDGRYAEARRHFAAARALLGATDRLPSAVSPEDTSRWLSCDPSGAMGFWMDAAATFESAAEPLALARALHNLSTMLLRRGEPLPARRLAGQACELKRGVAPAAGYAISRNALGMAERQLAEFDAARDDLEEARALGRLSGHRLAAAYALCNLAELDTDRGEIEAAVERFERSDAEKRANGDDYGMAYGWRAWARAHRLHGDLQQALHLARGACELRATTGDQAERADLLAELGACMVATGEREEARSALAEAVDLAAGVDAKATIALARLQQGLNGDHDAASIGLDLARRFQLRHLDPEIALVGTSRPGEPRTRLHPARGSGLRAHLIGDFRLLVGATAIRSERWRSKRAAEVLRLLTLHRGRAVGADDILEWIWPDGGRDSRQSLNAAISIIRRALEEAGGQRGWLERDSDHYRLGPFESTDVDGFEASLARASRALEAGRLELGVSLLEEALLPWHGRELLPRDRYATWAMPERTRLAAEVQRARERLAEAALTTRQVDLALATAREVVAAERVRETGYRLIIRACLAQADMAAAHQALRDCERALMDELGVQPSGETVALLPAGTAPG